MDPGPVGIDEGIHCMEFYEAIKSPLNPVIISHPTDPAVPWQLWGDTVLLSQFMDPVPAGRYEGIRCKEFYEAVISPPNPVTIFNPSYEVVQCCCHIL